MFFEFREFMRLMKLLIALNFTYIKYLALACALIIGIIERSQFAFTVGFIIFILANFAQSLRDDD